MIGGGNTAVEEALYLTNHATRVKLIHRREKLRAEKILQDRLLNNKKVEVLWNSVLAEVIGNTNLNLPQVTGMRVTNVQSREVVDIPIAGIFVAIGHTPNTDVFKGQIPMDEEGYLITKPDSTATAVPGIYAAGDVQDRIFRQAVTAAGTGCMAALEVEKYLTAPNAKEIAAAEQSSSIFVASKG